MSDEVALRIEAVHVRGLLAVAERDKLVEPTAPASIRQSSSTDEPPRPPDSLQRWRSAGVVMLPGVVIVSAPVEVEYGTHEVLARRRRLARPHRLHLR